MRRRWLSRELPRWRRVETDGGGFGLDDWGLDDSIVAGIVLGLAVAIATILLFVLVIPAIVFVAELAAVLVLAIGAGLSRVLLRRPWLVEARAGGEALQWNVVGWRASGRAVKTIATAIERGEDPDRALGRPNRSPA